ncbi:MAG TPA: hypothetical protein VIV06_01140, partial [Candidatus Limnocylindrales bacterium]
VELWVRFRTHSSQPWTAWTFSQSGTSSPFTYTFNSLFQQGDGEYEFATVGIDTAGNHEALPAVGDAAIHAGSYRVNDDTGNALHDDAVVTTGADGNVYAVWRDLRNSQTVGDIYFAKRNPTTGAWGPNERVDNASVGTNKPAIGVDAAGNVYVLWTDARNGNTDVWFSKRSAATGTWSASVRVNDIATSTAQYDARIAVLPSGLAVAVWTDLRGGKNHIYSARLAAGASTWSTNYKVTTDNGQSVKATPDVAIGSNGVAYAVWNATSGGTTSAWFASLPSGGTTWSSNTQIATPVLSRTQIAVDGAGALFAAFVHQSGSIAVRTRASGSGTWGGTTLFSVATEPSIAARSTGVAYLVWNSGSIIYGSRYNPATQLWGNPELVSPNDGSHYTPSVALTATDAIVASRTWDWRRATYDIRAHQVTVP